MLSRFAALVTLALAQAEALATLTREATTDGLTGLLNHRAFQQRLHVELAVAERHGSPLSLVMFDLDGFKLVNDAHGHDAGDEALRSFGEILERERRAGDVVARIGGDEFALIAPQTVGVDALAVAERIRRSSAAALADRGLCVSVSAGVADLTAAATMYDLIHLADSALYRAKHHGRDQAVHYTPGIDQVEHRVEIERRLALGALTALARTVDAKDASTQRHAECVAEVAVRLALALGWSPHRCARLREAALLHDVGKIGLPDEILTKAGDLTQDEYELVKAHPLLGAQIAEGILDDEQLSWLRGHHERPDGCGYPDGLSGAAVPDGARLIALADAYATITTGGPHRPGIPPAEAVEEIRRHAGTQFDPALIDVLARQALGEPDLRSPTVLGTDARG